MPTDPNKIKIFAGRSNPELAKDVCAYLKIPLGLGKVDTFPDGEIGIKIEEDVRGRDCYIVQSTCHPVNDNLMELFIWIDCLRRASAARVTAVIPYFAYARQDRKDSGRVPITAKMVANLLERAGADRVVAVDLHAAQIQGFFDIPVDHLYAAYVIKRWLKTLPQDNIVYVSPDVGNVKRAHYYAKSTGADIVVIDKRRKSGTDIEAVNIIGDVNGKNVIMIDDMISTAGTMVEAIKLIKAHGAKDIYIAASHGVFAHPAMERLVKAEFTKLAVTNTIPIGSRCDAIKDRLVVLNVAELVGEGIIRIHNNSSVSDLFKA